MKKKIAVCLLVLAFILTTVGCASQMNGSSYDNAVSEPNAYYYTGESMGTDEYSAADGGIATALDNGSFNYGGRKVIKSADMTLETDDFDAHYAYIIDQVTMFNGYLEGSDVSGRKPVSYGDSGRMAILTARIPEESFDAFMSAAETAGTLISVSTNTDDVTSQYYDIETRLEVLNVQHGRLLALLEQADDVESLIYIESEIANVTLQIEQLTSELRRYDGLIDYSTVSIHLRELSPSEGAVESASVWSRMSGGFGSTLRGVGEFFVEFGIFIVSALPVIIVLAVVAAVVVLIIRSSVRRRREKKNNALIEAGNAMNTVEKQK